tara:strand:+ start:3662 stop:3829 length:168 start_codon:yes stop_codon:yes gene_type:complete
MKTISAIIISCFMLVAFSLEAQSLKTEKKIKPQSDIVAIGSNTSSLAGNKTRVRI